MSVDVEKIHPSLDTRVMTLGQTADEATGEWRWRTRLKEQSGSFSEQTTRETLEAIDEWLTWTRRVMGVEP